MKEIPKTSMHSIRKLIENLAKISLLYVLLLGYKDILLSGHKKSQGVDCIIPNQPWDFFLNFYKEAPTVQYYLHNSSANASMDAAAPSSTADLIVTVISAYVMFLLFSNIPAMTLLAVGAQEPFSRKATVRFW